MERAELIALLRQHQLAVESSVNASGNPQAALVAFALTDAFELVFYARVPSRKIANLRRKPNIALVIGGWVGADQRTVQYEGRADFPDGAELSRVQRDYFRTFPGTQRLLAQTNVVWVRVQPVWMRYSDYGVAPKREHEFQFARSS